MMHADCPHPPQTTGIEAPSFKALAAKAIAALEEAGAQDFHIVCGPLSTGGTGNQIWNFQIFNACVRGLEARELRVFDQLPYEYGLRKLMLEWQKKRGADEYCTPILEEFYAPIFATRRIREGWFIPGWKTSRGATWEYQKFAVFGEIRHLRHSQIREFLRAQYPKDPEHVGKLMAALPSF